MKHSVNHHRVAGHAEDDPVREAARIHPADLLSLVTDAIDERVAREAANRLTNGQKKIAAKTLLLLLIPRFCLKEIGVNLGADEQTVFHAPVFRRNRASNSSHGIADPGSFSCAARRASMSALSSSE